MQSPKVVAGNPGEHVVFGVVVHVPIQKRQNWIECERPTANPKVGVFVGQTDVLGRIAQELNAGSKEPPEANRNPHWPISSRYADGSNDEMTC